jgi:excinuclease ABC subunit A
MAVETKAKKTTAKKAVTEQLDNGIFIKGARLHNLKNIDVYFPRNKFIVVTGVSGSGKSSLTIDTLFAEGQRRYAESLSAYARQFMQRMAKPEVDYIKGLCPAIAIEQKVTTRTPRSTVGSMTEVYDYFRLLFARAGHTYSPISGQEVKKDDITDVVKFVTKHNAGEKIYILAAIKQQKNRDLYEEISILHQKGFGRVLFAKGNKNLQVITIEDALEDADLIKKLAKEKTDAYIVVDRYIGKTFDEDDNHRIADSVQMAFAEGEGIMHVCLNENKFIAFNNNFEADGMKFEIPSPNFFSFNNPYGACPKCEGFGQTLGIDKNLVVPNQLLSVFEGAVAPWKGEVMGLYKDKFVMASRHNKFPIHKPYLDLDAEQLKILWHGDEYVEGIFSFFEEIEKAIYKIQNRVLLSRYRGKTECPSCEGYRLRKDASYVKINDKHIGELCEMPSAVLLDWFKKIKLNVYDAQVAKRLILEIENRLQTLVDVGLGYLTLNRLANSLSGGESQRIQLTRSLGSNLTDSLYILDEPSIGLHSRDTEKLIGVIKNLQKLGNTVVVVEHDDMMMRLADHIIDMGPLASHLGGEVIAAGNYNEIIKNPKSLTGQYLSGALEIDKPKTLRKISKTIDIVGARQNNLKNIDVSIPLGVIACVCGVSGSGKTTLIKQILYPALMRLKNDYSEKEGLYKSIGGSINAIASIEMIDQNPIGKSSRSNPVTYIKAWDYVREIFCNQPLSKMRGYMAKHFSFNVDGGRCDTCKGEGEQVVEMQFLADVHLTCESCKGHRFKDEVLEVRFKEKNIYEILELSVDEALELFATEKSIYNAMKPLQDVGLGYIKLGQSSDTLSGGEAQRVKLASFLGKGKSSGSILFIFDEPTTGLHFHDINKLLAAFNALVNEGHSIVVIEHNTEVIKRADWVIELGPEAGTAGGNLVFAGTPADLKKEKKSATGKYL